MLERRVHPRRRTYLGAILEFSDGRSTFDCLIRNESETGVRISLADTVGVPDKACLHIKKAQRRVAVRLAWRNRSACGLAFADWGGIAK